MAQAVKRLRAQEPRTVFLISVALIVLLALTIRLVGLGAESAWIDEAYSIVLARHALPDLIRGTAADQHPPLYYLLLHVWLWFGSGVSFARLLSVMIGTLNVAQVAALGRKLGGEWLGLGAALLLALNPMHVWYSQEARQYILLATLTTAASAELWNCLQGNRRWVLYALYAILSIYTQYFAVFIFLAHAVIVVGWVILKREKKTLLSWGLCYLALGLAFFPWLPTAINQFRFHTMSWIGEPAGGDVRDVLLRLLLGSGVLILPVLLRWLGIFSLVGVFGWAVWRLHGRSQEEKLRYSFLAIWALIPYITITLVSVLYPVFQFKQYLIVLAPLLLTAVFTAGSLPRMWKYGLYLGLLIAASASMVYQQATLTKDDWRGTAAYLQAHVQPGDLIYANPAASSLALSQYWDITIPYSGFPPGYDIVTGGWEGEEITPQIASSELIVVSQGHHRLWLVEFFPEFWDSGGYLASWLGEHGSLIDEQWFGKIHLRLYQLSP